MSFVHLHVHSSLSLLDSTIRIEKLVARVKSLGMTAVAVTDHVNLFGAIQFMKACKEAGIKPIYGTELLVRDPKNPGRNHHLVVLARDEDGFSNLRTLISRAYLESPRGQPPTLPREVVAQHAGGLIALSGCLGGEVPQALLKGDDAAARESVDFHVAAFGEGNFYLEIEANDLVEQDQANAALIDLSRRTGVPLVATNNAHYLDRDDAVAHAVLVSIDLKRNLNEEQRRNLPLRSFHLATPDEMAARFADVPEAIENTQRIADRIADGILKKTDKLHFPIFVTPKGESTAEYLTDLSRAGLDRRLADLRRLGQAPDDAAYAERLDRELGVIISLGFDAYYLIVWDFINWAKEHGIPVGPGRGSGAGSLVAFAIGITDIDPLRYDLLFERFLNPERVSPPDFDIDFCMEKRDRVYQYVVEKYGRERVGQIITFGSLKAKAVVRDVARVMGLSFADADRIAKLIPMALDMDLDKAQAQEPELARLLAEDPTAAELWSIAKKLEGLNRNAGKHAAGVVIADRPIADYAPLYVDEEGAVVTQFNMKDLDAVGLIKFDFLGLTALTVIQNAVDIIHARGNPDFRVEDVPLDDAATFELVCAGATGGVFQLETRGITDLTRRVRPDCIDDIIAIIALFRPGPLGSDMDKEFIAVKHGQKHAEYAIPELEPILKDTYGTILYQEQIMLIAQHLGGFTLGGADLLRRAMGKKDRKVLEAQREPFLKGAAERGIDAREAEKLFEKMTFFAEYGFNKSHSAAYAVVTYRMAYLKTHFPTEFLCAVLTAEKGDQNKIMRFLHEARDRGIPVLPPDVGSSDADFTVQDATLPDGTKRGAIRFGLTAVKGIGNSAVDAILSARKDGPFQNAVDLLTRIDLGRVNRKVVEALIRCGALDGFGHTRAALWEGLDRLMEIARSKKSEKESSQIGLFDLAPAGSRGSEVTGPDPLPEWSWRQRLAGEKETLGQYLTGHPLDPYRQELASHDIVPIGELAGLPDRTEVAIAGVVIQRTEKLTKGTGQKFAYVMLEDPTGQVECFVGTRTYEQWAAVAATDEPLLVRGRVGWEGENEDQLRLSVNSLSRLESARRAMVKAIQLKMDLGEVREAAVDAIRDLAKRHQGPCPLQFVLRLKGVGEMVLRASSAWGIDPTEGVVRDLEGILGAGAVTVL